MTLPKSGKQETAAGTVVVELEELPRKWKLLLVLGILLILSGILGLYYSVLVTIATVLLYGGMLLAGGALSLVHFFQAKEKKWHGRVISILLALLYIGAGVIIFINPLAASVVLTLVLGGIFMLMGLLRIIHAFRCRRMGWKWHIPLLVGVVDCIFALIIASTWPLSGLWVIGLFVSIELLMNGWLLTITALAVRKLAVDPGEQ